MLRLFMIAAIILLAILLIGLLVIYIRRRRFRPTKDVEQQVTQLNEDLRPLGFAYDIREDCFYSTIDCWQRETGYCRLYDEGAPLFNMIMDCEPIEFEYGGKRWLIELWKGQYGITTGGEIGIYNTMREDIHSEKFTGTFYENISEDEFMEMSFVLKRKGKVVLRRNGRHWWLTGFKLGMYSSPSYLIMEAKITFPNQGMCDVFTDTLRNIGYTKKEFSVRRRTVSLRYDKPHESVAIKRNKIQEIGVQQVNQNNCRLYMAATSGYKNTLDKLELLKATVPELYQFFLKSLYAKGFYVAFEWIKDLIFGHKPPHPPIPPEPPYPPYPPEPPCPPCPPEPPCRHERTGQQGTSCTNRCSPCGNRYEQKSDSRNNGRRY